MGKPKKWKRRRPKSGRAGCLLCKPHKHQNVDQPARLELKARLDEKEQLEAIVEKNKSKPFRTMIEEKGERSPLLKIQRDIALEAFLKAQENIPEFQGDVGIDAFSKSIAEDVVDMSHTYADESGVRFHYNSDLSGDVRITTPDSQDIKVPASALIRFVAGRATERPEVEDTIRALWDFADSVSS